MAGAACAKRIIDAAVAAVATETAEVADMLDPAVLDNLVKIDQIYLDLTLLAHDTTVGLEALLLATQASVLKMRQKVVEVRQKLL